jgi:hypothetical protein
LSDKDIFIIMNKNKKITIRITESQMRRLSDTLINEQINQSQFLREMIDKYVRNCRKTNKKGVQQVIQEIKDTDSENKKSRILNEEK